VSYVVPFLLALCFAIASITVFVLVAKNRPPLWLTPWWWPGRESEDADEAGALTHQKAFAIIAALAMAAAAWSLIQIAFSQVG
jgi:hypothetical protein